MARWEREYDDYPEDYHEESKLLEKLHDYLNLEKKMLEHKKEREQSSFKSLRNRKVVVALIEGTILAGLTCAFLVLWGI